MNAAVRDVVVIGGGISGLTAARRLQEAGLDACLVEASEQVGGCARTEQRDGFLLEKGPFNVVVRDATFERLLEDLGSEVNVVTADPAAKERYIYFRNGLRPVPMGPGSLLNTLLLSSGGRWRLLSGLLASGRPHGEDETIEQTVVRRFGREVADRIVSAAISGIYAGDIGRLSLRACFPSVAAADAGTNSPLGHALFGGRGRGGSANGAPTGSNRSAKPKRKWRGLISLDRGLGGLSEALGRLLGERLVTGCRVDAIQRSKGRYGLRCVMRDGTEHTVACRRVVVATEAPAASRLLGPLIPEAAALLGAIESTSLVVLNLAFDRRAIEHPMRGYGFLVPRGEETLPVMGVLWADSIFPHHAPAGCRLIRVFVGGVRDPEAVMRSDHELLTTSLAALRGVLGIRGDPVLVDCCRYRNAIPQYHVGHVERVRRLEELQAANPGLHVIGNYLHGVSINDCVRVAHETSQRIIAEESARHRERRVSTSPAR